ncbi:hypothetical protein Taro_033095, partial [Colocasia esculenta]|nr:hypothetical protein [Colocasia esculenta]
RHKHPAGGGGIPPLRRHAIFGPKYAQASSLEQTPANHFSWPGCGPCVSLYRPHESGKAFDTRWCCVSAAGPFCARPHRDAAGCYKTPESSDVMKPTYVEAHIQVLRCHETTHVEAPV